MHEFHIVKDLFFDLIEHVKKNNAKKISKVYLRMGEFTEINEDILKHYFKEHGKDTELKAAKLVIEKSPNRELTLVSFDCE